MQDAHGLAEDRQVLLASSLQSVSSGSGRGRRWRGRLAVAALFGLSIAGYAVAVVAVHSVANSVFWVAL